MTLQPSFAGVDECRALLRTVGIDMPTIPPELAPAFQKRVKWMFSSTSLELVPYTLDVCIRDVLDADPPDLALCAHQGHGINSYAMHYVLVRRPLFLFTQIGFGGVYMDEDKSRSAVNDAFRVCDEIVALAEARIADKKLERDRRLVIVASDFWSDLRTYPPAIGDRNAPTPNRGGTVAAILGRWRDWLRTL